jgi:hypothetical protein
MKFLKSTLAILVLLGIGSVDAKQVKKATTTTSTTPQTEQPSFAKAPEGRPQGLLQQPTKAKTFEQFFNEVKNARNAWDNKTQLLNQTFVDNLMNDTIDAKIGRSDLGFLLNVARDYHAQFTGPKKDIDILKALEKQQREALDNYDISAPRF